MSAGFDPLALRLYHVTDQGLSRPRSVPEVVRAAVRGGATMIQVRGKDLEARQLLELLISVAEAVGELVPVVVDDRVDVHLAAVARGAACAGVHLGQTDLPVEQARALCGPEAIVGLSASTREQLRDAEALAPGTVDYLGIGAVRATATKSDAPQPLGLEGFARTRPLTRLPSVAIGGVRVEDTAALIAAGADGVAVVSGICAAADPETAARAYRAEVGR